MRKLTLSKLVDTFKEFYLKNVEEAINLSEYHLYKEDIGENLEDGDNGKHSDNDLETIQNNKVHIEEFARSLKISSEIYSRIRNRTFSNRKINDRLFNLERIKSFPSYTFLLDLFQRKEIGDKDLIEILKIVETFMLRWHICEKRTNELDDIFPKLVEIKNDPIVTNIKAFLKKHIPPDDEFKDKFSAYSFQGNAERAKYVLEEIEYFITKNTGEYSISGSDDVHLEHIIPQTIDTRKAKKEQGDWVSYLGSNALEKHGDHVYLIGNLTLLADELNIKASNNPFRAKKKEYRKSNITLTKNVADNYKSFKFKQVTKRSVDLAKSAVAIWTF